MTTSNASRSAQSTGEPTDKAPSDSGPARSKGGATGEARRIGACAARATGCEVQSVEAIAPGLGLRRFYRVHLDAPPGSLIARVEAPEDPAGRPAGVAPEPALEPVRALLEAHGLPVPARLGAEQDIELLEDAGAVSLCDFAKREGGARAEKLVIQALDALPRLQAIRNPGGVAAFERRLDAATFAYKAALFTRYSLPLALRRAPKEAEQRAVQRAFAFIAGLVAEAPARLAHRDFQSRNLLVQNGKLVWIDLQGALLAPPEYDPVCLLRDSHVDWGEAFIEARLADLRTQLPDAPAMEIFRLRCDALTLARKGKDHARFLYIARERGDATLLADVPLTVRHLQRAASRLLGVAPELDPLCEWLFALPQHAPAP